MTAQEEVRVLVDQLGRLASRAPATADDRREAYRLLHSIKSWASLAGQADLLALCDGLENQLRAEAQLNPALRDELAQAIPLMVDYLAVPLAVGQRTDPDEAVPGGWFALSAALPSFNAAEFRQIQALRTEGRQLRWCRVWLAPAEPLPITRLMVLYTRLEALGIIKAEAWLANDGAVSGPFDPHDWIQGHHLPADWTGRGGWLRCCYVANSAAGLKNALQMDQLEAVIDSPLPGQPNLAPAAAVELSQLPALGREDIGRQTMLLELAAGAKPAEIGDLLAEMGQQPVAPWLWQLVRQASPQLAAEPAFRAGVDWQLYDEALRLSPQTLAVLGEILRQFLRNSAAHAGQTPVERQRGHKAPASRVGIAFWEEADYVFMRYQDDGAGIDPRAVERRLAASPGSLDTDAKLLAAIIQAEVSTQAEPSSSAGHGMGLELVQQLVVEVLQGELSLANWPGQGCSFTLRWPRGRFDLTVLLLRHGATHGAIPQVWLAGCLDLASLALRRDRHGQEFIGHAGQNLALHRLGPWVTLWLPYPAK